MTLSAAAAAATEVPNKSFSSDIHPDEDDDDRRLWIWEEKEVSSPEVDMELMEKKNAKRLMPPPPPPPGSSTTGSPEDAVDESSASSVVSADSSTHGVIHDMVSLTSRSKTQKRYPHSFTIHASGALTPSPLGRSRRAYGVVDDSDDDSSLEGGGGGLLVTPPRPPARNASLGSGNNFLYQKRLLDRQSSYSKQSILTTPINSPRSHRAMTATMLGNLMMEKDWEGVLDVLESSEGADAAASWQYGTSDGTVGDGGGGMWKRLPLHHACSLGAPIGILDKLLDHFPEALEKADPYSGMMPLHLACQMTASAVADPRHYPPSPSIVGALLSLKQGIKATKHADSIYGRLPLHWACINASRIAGRNNTTETSTISTNHHQSRMLTAANKIVSRLLQVNPSAVIVRDEAQDKTPLDYATDGGVSSNNLKLMQKLYNFMNKVYERSKRTVPSSSSLPLNQTPSFHTAPPPRRRRGGGVLHQIGEQQLSVSNISFHKEKATEKGGRLAPTATSAR